MNPDDAKKPEGKVYICPSGVGAADAIREILGMPGSATDGAINPGDRPRPPQPPAPNADAIPSKLKERHQYVLWKYVLRNRIWTKIPYQTRYPLLGAKADDPSTWAPFKETYVVYFRGGFDGIGYEFSADDPYFGVDFDNCLRDGKLLEWVIPFVDSLKGAYGEISPSGNGIKFYATGKLPGESGTRRSGMGPDGIGAIELYDHGRYFAMTGDVYGGEAGDVCADRQASAEWLYNLAKEGSKAKQGSKAKAKAKPKAKAASNGHASADADIWSIDVEHVRRGSELTDDELLERTRPRV